MPVHTVMTVEVVEVTKVVIAEEEEMVPMTGAVVVTEIATKAKIRIKEAQKEEDKLLSRYLKLDTHRILKPSYK